MRRQLLAGVGLVAVTLALAACGGKEGVPETETTGTVQSAGETTPASATTTGVTGGTSSAMTPADKEFVAKAGMGGLAEVQLGNLALQNAANADVRAFAQMMVTDHSAANAELAQLATSKGVALPTELEGDPKKSLDHLNGLTGSDFDRAYMQHMVADHEKDIAEFQRASVSARDADVRAWAAAKLTTLKEHLRQAQGLAGKV